MRLYYAPDDWRHYLSRQAWPEACVATIGNFDGVHGGHRVLVEQTAVLARREGLPALGISFEPHPAQVLRGNEFLLLQSLEQRVEALARAGLDILLILPFTREFASGDAQSFSRDILGKTLGVRTLFIGHDFRMGRDQAGGDQLAAYGREAGFEVRRVDAVLAGGRPVSSSRIRDALAGSDLEQANSLLGSLFAARGAVSHGAGRGGRLLGFPTANMDVRGLCMPNPAVYATCARLIAEGAAGSLKPGGVYHLDFASADKTCPWYPAMTSFGKNPTFGQNRLSLETFILDFDQDIYGRELEVAFLREMRQEITFSGPEELIAQLSKDLAARREQPGPSL